MKNWIISALHVSGNVCHSQKMSELDCIFKVNELINNHCGYTFFMSEIKENKYKRLSQLDITNRLDHYYSLEDNFKANNNHIKATLTSDKIDKLRTEQRRQNYKYFIKFD